MDMFRKEKEKQEKGFPIRWPDGTVTYSRVIKCGTPLLQKRSKEKAEAAHNLLIK